MVRLVAARCAWPRPLARPPAVILLWLVLLWPCLVHAGHAAASVSGVAESTAARPDNSQSGSSTSSISSSSSSSSSSSPSLDPSFISSQTRPLTPASTILTPSTSQVNTPTTGISSRSTALSDPQDTIPSPPSLQYNTHESSRSQDQATAIVSPSIQAYLPASTQTCELTSLSLFNHPQSLQCPIPTWPSAFLSVSTATAIPATATVEAIEAETDSPLDNAKFLSFEEWKKQNLAQAGQSADAVGHGRASTGQSQGQPRQRPAGSNNGLDSLGEDSEIELDFGGFAGVSPERDPEQIQQQRQQQQQQQQRNSATQGSAVPAQSTGPAPYIRSKDAGVTCKERFNYASFDCAANVLKTNPKCKSSSSILIENKDSYMLNECSVENKFLIVELCDDILIDTVVLANFEFFSSIFRTFRVSVSDRYPVKTEKWKTLGVFEARNTREIQAFLIENPLIWARYVRIEFLSHYGSEFYCPLSLLRIHGTTMMEEFRHQEALARGDIDPEEEEEARVVADAVAQHKPVEELALPQQGDAIASVEKVIIADAAAAATASHVETIKIQTTQGDSPVISTDGSDHVPTISDGSANAIKPEKIPPATVNSSGASAAESSTSPSTTTQAPPISQKDEPTRPTTEAAANVCNDRSRAADETDANYLAMCGIDESPVTTNGNTSKTHRTTSVTAIPNSASHERTGTDAVTSIFSAKDVYTSTMIHAQNSTTLQPATNSPNATTVSQNQTQEINTKVPVAASPSEASTSSSDSLTTTQIPSSAGVVTGTASPPTFYGSSTAGSVAASPPPPPPPAASPATQESFFKSIHKRLQSLETNATLSLQYIEAQSQLLRDAFGKVEKRQLNKTSQFLDSLNKTVLTELARFKGEYEQLWQSTVIELASQRDEGRRERELLGERVRLLAEEMVSQKRLMAGQATLLLLCLGLIMFGRLGSPQSSEPGFIAGMQDIVRRSRSGKRAALFSSESTAGSGGSGVGSGMGRDVLTHHNKNGLRSTSTGRDGIDGDARHGGTASGLWGWESPWASPARSPQPTRPSTSHGRSVSHGRSLSRETTDVMHVLRDLGLDDEIDDEGGSGEAVTTNEDDTRPRHIYNNSLIQRDVASSSSSVALPQVPINSQTDVRLRLGSGSPAPHYRVGELSASNSQVGGMQDPASPPPSVPTSPQRESKPARRRSGKKQNWAAGGGAAERNSGSRKQATRTPPPPSSSARANSLLNLGSGEHDPRPGTPLSFQSLDGLEPEDD